LAVLSKVKRAWNAFVSADQNKIEQTYSLGTSTSVNPMQARPIFFNEKSMLSSVLNRMSIDVAGVNIRHVIEDEYGRYKDDVKSELNECLTREPNIDQGPRAFRQDIAETLFDHGVAAIVPIDTIMDPKVPGRFDILSLRVGIIKEWFPKHVKVSVWNEVKGLRQEIILEKSMVGIVENPLYRVMNEPSGTLQRLTRKLQLLDVVDEQSSSGKLDLIIQLPYTIKSEARRKQAEQRREDIEFQLKGSQYGIAYTAGTEKITQLNRPAENNLLKQVEYLTGLLYSQLGITEEVMNGTADEKTMINYYSRTIEPILDSIVEAMQRTLVPRRTKQRISYFRDPFKLVPLSDIAEIADKLSRNEILSSNEIRSFMGISPSNDPKADKLMNSNMPNPEGAPTAPPGPTVEDMDSLMDEVFNGLAADIDSLVKGSG
jgi:hypothetical protein